MAAPKKQKVDKTAEEAAHEAWFFSLEPQYVVQLMQEWNELKLDIKLKKKRNYDDWLNYFKGLPASHIRMLVSTGQDILTAEAYAALRRWADIISNPGRIDKIHQAGLTSQRGKQTSIAALAAANDRLGVLKATRQKVAEKLDKGAGNRDTTLLTAQITEIMSQIAHLERKIGPKDGTVLSDLLHDMPEIKRKRPAENGGGARHTSFRSRVTIDDMEQPSE